MDSRGNASVIDAMVPLANMFGYVNTLRSMSQGRAQYSMQFDHYEQVPQAVADEVALKWPEAADLTNLARVNAGCYRHTTLRSPRDG